MYEKSHIDKIDYYHKKAYEYYSNGDQPLIKYINYSTQKLNKKIIIIRDSFNSVVTPFLALIAKELIIVDPRYFNGSIKTLIKQEKPDIVILAYEASCVSVGKLTRWKLD